METKFRVWDKKFINPANIVMRLDGHLFDRESGDELHSVEIIQFTGLHDKNGKEYYHKDIFKFDELIYCVEYNFGGFGYYDRNQIWQWLYTVAIKAEIIGNIYENPELLESE